MNERVPRLNTRDKREEGDLRRRDKSVVNFHERMLNRGWYLITVAREIELQIKHGQLLIFALRSGWIMKCWRQFEFLPAPFLHESNAFRLTVRTRHAAGFVHQPKLDSPYRLMSLCLLSIINSRGKSYFNLPPPSDRRYPRNPITRHVLPITPIW